MMLVRRNVLVHSFSRCSRLPSSSSSSSSLLSISPSNRIIRSYLPSHKLQSSTATPTNNNNPPTPNFAPHTHKYTTPTPTRHTHNHNHNSIFPWRHSPHPLPRLTPHTLEEYDQGGEFGPNFPMRGGTMTHSERGLIWCQSVYVLGLRRPWGYGVWKRELEEGFLTAFAMGLQGVLVDVYRAPTSIEDEDETGNDKDDENEQGADDDHDYDDKNAYSVRMDRTIDTPIQDSDDNRRPSSTNEPTTSQKQKNTHKNTTNNTQTNTPKPTPKTKQQPPSPIPSSNDERPNLHDMLESNLQSLYHSAHSTAKSKLNIHLECQPKSASLVSLFTIPLLTRDEVTQDPSLRNLYPDLYQKLLLKAMDEMERTEGRNTSLSWRQVYGEMKEFVETKVANQEGEEGVVQMTVVAQAVIECEEVFAVRDVESGVVVQGDEDGEMREVQHLVRFEMVVDWDWQREELIIGNWQITDWDDLLDGNIWYL